MSQNAEDCHSKSISCTCLGSLGSTREFLLKRKKGQYHGPPCTNLFRSAAFNVENIVLTFNKKSYLNEEANFTEPSLSVRVPGNTITNRIVSIFVTAVKEPREVPTRTRACCFYGHCQCKHIITWGLLNHIIEENQP